MARFVCRKNCSRFLAQQKFVRRLPLQLQIELTAVCRRDFGLGWKKKIETESVGEALATFRSETFEMIIHENPNAACIGEVALDFQRPAFERGFALPQQFPVTMNVAAIAIVLRGVIAE